MNNKILKMYSDDTIIVIPSAKKEDEQLNQGFQNYGINYNIFENKKPLMETLLSIRESEEYKDPLIQYIICTHDDVILRDNNFLNIKKLAFQNFDYWGVAGTNLMLSSDPRWHVPFGGNKKYCSGLMEHVAPEGYNFMSFYGPYPMGNIAIIDGVFMAFKKKVFDNIELIKDYDGFHFYDIEMCTQLWAQGFKGGVMGLHLFHASRGEGILTDDYKKYSEIYSKRWADKKVIGSLS